MVRCSVLWRRSVDGLSIPPPPSKPADKVIELKYEELLTEAGEKQRADFVKNAGVESLVAVTFGYTSGDSPVSISAGLVGYQVVWGVGDKCHFRRDREKCQLVCCLMYSFLYLILTNIFTLSYIIISIQT